jgi:hypothetical protein
MNAENAPKRSIFYKSCKPKVVKKKITAADGNLAQLNITGKKLEETFNINYIHKT